MLPINLSSFLIVTLTRQYVFWEFLNLCFLFITQGKSHIGIACGKSSAYSDVLWDNEWLLWVHNKPKFMNVLMVAMHCQGVTCSYLLVGISHTRSPQSYDLCFPFVKMVAYLILWKFSLVVQNFLDAQMDQYDSLKKSFRYF